jgi:hypothetical protein
MITIEKQTDAAGILQNTFTSPFVAPSTNPRETLAPGPSESGQGQGVKIISSQSLTTWVHGLARDAKNPSVTTFPFALGVYLTFMTGTIALGWGTLLDSVWLAVTGFLVALAGCGLYGVSQRDD